MSKSALLTSAQGLDGTNLVFYVDSQSKIRMYSLAGAQSQSSDDYISQSIKVGNDNVLVNSKDLAALSFQTTLGDLTTTTIRVYYVNKDNFLRELWRDGATGPWKDGQLNDANIQAAADSPISSFYNFSTKQLMVYFYQPGTAGFPSVAWMDGATWVAKPIASSGQ